MRQLSDILVTIVERKAVFMNIFSFIKKNIYKNSYKTLFLVDILYMKDINAVYGYENGDSIIAQLKHLLDKKIPKKVKSILTNSVPIEIENFYIDVFGITFYANLEEQTLTKIKDIIFETVIGHKFYLIDGTTQINLDITIGCSKSNDNKLRVYAEKALHSAKLNYVHYMYFDANLFKNELKNIDLIPIMQYNIKQELVEPYFQPIVDTNTLEIHKYEALMRLFDEEGNLILPGIFIHRAKKYRLYTKLMSILIDKVIAYIIKHKKHFSINLDFHDILNPHIKKQIIAHLENNDVGNYLTIEILESEKISNFETVNDFIHELKKYNVSIAIDDFGTGFSNYDYILKLNIDYIKIDGSLIKKVNEEIYSNLIRSIVVFCKQHNIKVIAEFVSDLKTLRFVRSLGIDYSQGYYVGKPKSINNIIEVDYNEE